MGNGTNTRDYSYRPVAIPIRRRPSAMIIIAKPCISGRRTPTHPLAGRFARNQNTVEEGAVTWTIQSGPPMPPMNMLLGSPQVVVAHLASIDFLVFAPMFPVVLLSLRWTCYYTQQWPWVARILGDWRTSYLVRHM